MLILATSFVIFIFQTSVYANDNAFTSFSCFSMGGAGYLYQSANTQIKNPAVFNKKRSFTTSIVKYPASIRSQSLNLNLPTENFVFSSSLKHLSYGVFKGYDEYGGSIGSYKSYETWVDGYFAKKINSFPIYLGSSLSLKSSNFHNANTKNLSTSFGLIKNFKNENNSIGISINQFGINFFNGKRSYTNPRIVLSSSKKLKYLPAISYIDFLQEKNHTEVFMGICFIYSEKIKILAGSSTRKFDQNTSQSLITSILGSTGFGLSYDTKQILVQYGFYYYGIGTRVDGLNIGMSF